MEDWEIELLQVNDCVAEARILEKYKDLVFYDPDTKKTFKVWGGNLEFHSGSRRTGNQEVGSWFASMRIAMKKGGF